MTVGKQLSDGNPDGTSLGQDDSDLVSLHGATPIARATAPAAVSVVNPATISTGQFGFSTSTQVSSLVTAVNSIRTALINKGILKS